MKFGYKKALAALLAAALAFSAAACSGVETMSQAVSMSPELYAAYLHGASRWDGEFSPLAENGVAVYIFMAQDDEYYGSRRAREAYDGLHMTLMPLQAGAMQKRKRFCKFKRRIKNGLPVAALQAIITCFSSPRARCGFRQKNEQSSEL